MPTPFRCHDTVPNLTLVTLRQLAQEWVELNADPSAARQVQSWKLTLPQEGVCLQPADVVDLYDVADFEQKNALLYGLVAERQGSYLAGRIVLQIMLPQLLTVARLRYLNEQRMQDVIASFWMVLGGYPATFRKSVSINLIAGTKRSLEASDTPHQEIPVDEDSLNWGSRVPLNTPTDDDPRRQLEELLGHVTDDGTVTAQAVQLLRTVYLDHPDKTSAQIAALLGLSATALRQRCSRTIRAIAATHALHPA